MWSLFQPEFETQIKSKIKATVARSGVEMIDLTGIEHELSLREFEVNPADAHPNEHAHKLIAERIFKRLRTL